MSNEDSNVTETIELVDLPAPNTQGYSSSRNAPNDSDEAQDLQHINSQHDELERKLQPKCLDNTDIQAFLRDYAQFKDRPGLEVFKYMVEFELFQPPFTFESPLFSIASSGQRQGHASVDKKTSFSHLVDSLRTALNAGATECARFCILSSDKSTTIQSALFPLSSKLLATVSQLHRKYNAPKLAILYLVDQQWGLPKDILKSYMEASKKEKEKSSLELPSESFPKAPFNLDDGSKIVLELKWLASAPQYQGQLYSYIWQPHAEAPEAVSAQLFVFRKDEQGCRNILLLLSSMDLSDEMLRNYLNLRREAIRTHSSNPSNVESQIFWAIYTVYRQLVTGSATFIESSLEQITSLRYNGRQSPSNAKLNYLIHLEDCCKVLSSGLAHASSLLREISVAIASNHTRIDTELQAWPEKTLQDIEFLENKLGEVQRQLLEIREMIKEQLELRNGRRTSLLTLLAAIYIPFSFMSSLFGMNLSDPIWGPIIPAATRSDSPTNSTSNTTNSTGFSQNQTNAIIGEIASSGGYLWSFKLYWIISASVTLATILLPLVAGPIFRSTVRAFYRNRTYLRPLVAITGLGGFTYIDVALNGYVYTIVFGTTLGAIALFMLCRASRSGKNQVIWCGYSITFAASFTIDQLVDTGPVGISGYVSLGYLLVASLRPEIRKPLQFITRHYVQARDKWLDYFHTKIKRWTWQVVVVVIYYSFTACVLRFVPFYGLMPIFSIPLGVLSINRSIRSCFAQKHVYHWILYTLIFGVSLTIDLAAPIYGFTCFLPMSYLFGFYIYHDHVLFFRKQLQRLRQSYPQFWITGADPRVDGFMQDSAA